MCGRFNVIDNPELQKLLQELGIDLALPTRSNIAPTETIAMVRAAEVQRELVDVRWWLTPHWARQPDQKYSMFNARSETLASSRAFAVPFKRRRAIVPVSSFIEWRTEQGGAKQPWLIAAEGSALALAAVWDHWEGDGQVIESCALVTTAAAPEFEQIHRRMPVMLAAAECERWLDVSQELAGNDPLFAPQLKVALSAVPISRGVNNARNKDVDLLDPVDQAIRIEAAGLHS
ncbi:MAG: SOS response-associated peptidase [Halieaceae bacterium]